MITKEDARRLYNYYSQIETTEKLLSDLEKFIQSQGENVPDVIPIANKLLYETAQQQNMNLWNLCMMVAPDFEYVTKLIDGKAKMVCEVKLVPLEFDYTHSPDYWEEKYKELKSKLQDLIFKENE